MDETVYVENGPHVNAVARNHHESQTVHVENAADYAALAHAILCLFRDDDQNNVLVEEDNMMHLDFPHVLMAYQDRDALGLVAVSHEDPRHRRERLGFHVVPLYLDLLSCLSYQGYLSLHVETSLHVRVYVYDCIFYNQVPFPSLSCSKIS
jgi:hypothetical protein